MDKPDWYDETLAEVREALQRYVDTEPGGMQQFAERHNVHRHTLRHLLQGKGEIRVATVKRVARGLAADGYIRPTWRSVMDPPEEPSLPPREILDVTRPRLPDLEPYRRYLLDLYYAAEDRGDREEALTLRTEYDQIDSALMHLDLRARGLQDRLERQESGESDSLEGFG